MTLRDQEEPQQNLRFCRMKVVANRRCGEKTCTSEYLLLCKRVIVDKKERVFFLGKRKDTLAATSNLLVSGLGRPTHKQFSHGLLRDPAKLVPDMFGRLCNIMGPISDLPLCVGGSGILRWSGLVATFRRFQLIAQLMADCDRWSTGQNTALQHGMLVHQLCICTVPSLLGQSCMGKRHG